ncbi:MAG: outer membrane beta-barrel protein [bacterium]|nr:outer membrane beta-barrel protein [bacterium]
MKRNLDWQRIWGVALAAMMFVSAFAQADVVYLKDGSVIKGKVIESVPGVSYKIKTADGSIFVFAVEKVAKISFGEEEMRVEVKKGGVYVIYLKNGSVIRGKIIESVPDISYKIITADGSIFVLTMERIEKIEPGEEAEKVISRRVEEKPALPIQKMPISVGGGMGSFKIKGYSKKDVEGRGGELFGDLRYMVRENIAIQGELRSGKHSGDEDDVKSTYKYLSYGATGLLLFKPSPENPFSLYTGGGLSRYNWDYSGEVSWEDYYGYWTLNLSSKESDWGYHLCGGGEYPISKNLFLWGEVRKIIGTIEKPKIKYKIELNGRKREGELTGEDWDYGHMVFRGGLRLSF